MHTFERPQGPVLRSTVRQRYYHGWNERAVYRCMEEPVGYLGPDRALSTAPFLTLGVIHDNELWWGVFERAFRRNLA
jgi:hypothetical protein